MCLGIKNIGIVEETFTRSGTFHVSHCVVLRWKEQQEPALDLQLKYGRSRVLHAPPEITGLQNANKTNSKPGPVFSEAVQQNWYFPDDQKIAQIN